MPAFSWFRIDAGTWIGSLDIRALTPAERGVLTDLRALQVLNGPLPNNPERLATHLRCGPEVVERVLSAFFKLDDDRWLDPELEAMRERVTAISEKRAVAGRAGGQAPKRAKPDRSKQAGKQPAKQMLRLDKRREEEKREEGARGRGRDDAAASGQEAAPSRLTFREMLAAEGIHPPHGQDNGAAKP